MAASTPRLATTAITEGNTDRGNTHGNEGAVAKASAKAIASTSVTLRTKPRHVAGVSDSKAMIQPLGAFPPEFAFGCAFIGRDIG